MGTADEPHRFERVDWDDVDRRRRLVSAERVTLVVGGLLLVALYLYDAYVAHVYTVGDWRARPVDWVFLAAVVLLFAYGVVPAIRHREKVGRVGKRVVSRPVTLLAGVYLAVFAVVGFLGPVVFSNPGLQFQHAFHPPVGFSSQIAPVECLGETTEAATLDRRCHGSLSYPLGTNERGHPMGFLLAAGARVALYVVVFTAVFVVPLAATVGVVAGVRGGLVDDLLMGYVDIQLSIPAIILYFIGYAYWNPSLLLLLVTFGLLSWGGIARLVRSEVLQRREDGYVLVARSLGASEPYIAKRHILPNVTNTLVPAVFHLFAMLVLIEAGIAFLGFHELEVYSWGSTISESVNAAVPGHVQSRADYPAYQIWWVSTLPALALTLTMLSFKLVGDGVRDALDPRRRH
ncbi:ABC transporter permease [Natrononativus amylolyticus]|uniref:ABC transporter permease n=1 Tax=Natrononativus amylolyticus TaxID=2963434 RepID=UPI0020CDBF25|nr:ABC transporter permease [Natrononativus amylolyticus]